MTFFSEEIYIFTAKISDDLFLVIEQVFRIFPFFSPIYRSFTMLNVIYDPFPHMKNHYFRKENSFMTLLLLCSYFRANPTTLLLEILEGWMHGPSPPQIRGGRPPVPPIGLRPCSILLPHF